MRVAVYGGSFDPPHLGHVMVVAHLLLNEPSLDEVWIVPCFEQAGKHLTPYSHRLQMCDLAFGQFHRCRVNDVERKLGGESITLRTFKYLAHVHPNDKFQFVIGSDLLESVATWGNWDELCKIAPPLVVGRAGITSPQNPTPICPAVSSTLVREALAAGRYGEAERYLSVGVLHHICNNELYVTSKGLQPCVAP